jgi:replicative DNA helicase
MVTSTDPYNLSSDFEQALIYHLIYKNDMYAKIGKYLEPEAFCTPVSRLVVSAILQYSNKHGKCPGSDTTVRQLLLMQHDEGKVTADQLLDVEEYLLMLAATEQDVIDNILNAFIPMLKQRRFQTAARRMVEHVAKRPDSMKEMLLYLQETENLGESSMSPTFHINDDNLDAIRALQLSKRLSTGIKELDTELGGGPPIQSLNMCMAASGDGKSTFLVHAAAAAARAGYHVGVLTLELPVEVWMAKLYGNLYGIPVNSLLESKSGDGMVGMLAERKEKCGIFNCAISMLSPRTSKVVDIMSWVDRTQVSSGKKLDVLVVDYGDLVGHNRKKKYEGLGDVYTDLRQQFAIENDGWVWTASATNKKKNPKDFLTADNTGDSLNKFRLCDTCVAMELSEDGSELSYKVLKNRLGIRGRVEKLPTEFECSRITRITPVTTPGMEIEANGLFR